MSAEDIAAFASAHGVLIHPRIAAGYGSLESFVDETGSKCPFDDSLVCPCDQALDELTSRDPMDQHCHGYLFVTEAYVKSIDPKGKLYSEQQQPTPVPLDDVDQAIKEYVADIDETRKLFDAGEYEDAFDKLVDMEETTDCTVCKEKFATEAMHVNNTRNLCSLPYAAGCAEEKARVKARLDKLRDFYAKAGKTEIPEPKTSPSGSTYREDMAAWLKSAELQPYEQKIRFYMASQLAGNKASNVEEALASAQQAHPEWF
ncbi:MAG: hypothetical protein WC565_03255 [Parcubacteria group bacterium]|jgi:hypothetical protein